MARRFGRRNARGGSNVGTHGADKRWKSPDGRRWDSQLEGLIAIWLDANGVEYEAQPQPSLGYTTKIRGGKCADCGSDSVVQHHTYTPDFLTLNQPTNFYIEVKGFFRQGVRPAMQEFIKQNQGVPLRYVFSRNNKLPLKRTPDYLTWAAHYGCPALVWNEKRGLDEWFN